MSAVQIPSGEYYASYQAARPAKPGEWEAGYNERPKWIPLLFVPGILLSAISWMAGGIPMLTDFSMVTFTVILAGLFINDLVMFPRRFGFGGLIAFGGGLLWWCYDYHIHWLGYNGTMTGDQMMSAANIESVPSWVLAKAVCLHIMFMCFITIGLKAKKHLWLSRIAYKTIEPNNSLVLFVIVIVIFMLSLIPYMFFTEDGFFEAIGMSIVSGYSGVGVRWTTGRTGSVNYSWGGYLAELVRLGYAGATMAAFHATLFTRSNLQKFICYFIFIFQVALAFGTGARGNVVFTCLPLAIIMYLRYNFMAAELYRKFSKRAYIVTLALLFAMLFLIQVQGYFRTEGFSAESFKNVEVSELRGNEMFTTTLPGMAIFPDKSDFIDEPFKGAGFFVALPKTFYWFAVGPIPRALWTTKPIDNTWTKYNSLTTGRAEDDYVGTTISRGSAGDPYFRWGLGGLIEVGWLYGLILRNCEVGIRHASGRPITLLFILGWATFIFRAFRDLSMQEIYPVLIAAIVMSVTCYLLNTAMGGQRQIS